MTTPPGDGRRGVIIPTYNSGPILATTVRSVLARWQPVIVAIDGSTDESTRPLAAMASGVPGLHLVELSRNVGKGAAVHAGMEVAARLGLTHVAVFDADGQHDTDDLPRFMKASSENPGAMILGTPVFGPDAPRERVVARRVANFLTGLESGGVIADSLFGFRVYPLGPALGVMNNSRQGRGYDFETHLAVHLVWLGVPAVNLPSRVRYLARSQGGVSHYRYLRDNLLLARRHAALLLERSLRTATSLPGQAARKRALATSPGARA